MNAQNRNLQAANVRDGIQQGAVAADAEHELRAAQRVAASKIGGAFGQAQAPGQVGAEGFDDANFGLAGGQVVEQGLDVGQGGFVEGLAQNGDFHNETITCRLLAGIR